MKQLIIIIIIAAVTLLKIQAQTKDGHVQELSLSEKFTSKTGVIIEKQFIEVGNIDVIDVRLLKSKDLSNGTTNNALRFEYQFNNEIQSLTKIAVLDADEIDPLINALKLYVNTILNSTRTSNTEITFLSKTNFVVGCFYKLEKNKWVTYIQLNHNDPKSTVYIEYEEITHFIELLELTKTKL